MRVLARKREREHERKQMCVRETGLCVGVRVRER